MVLKGEADGKSGRPCAACDVNVPDGVRADAGKDFLAGSGEFFDPAEGGIVLGEDRQGSEKKERQCVDATRAPCVADTGRVRTRPENLLDGMNSHDTAVRGQAEGHLRSSI